MEDRWKDLYSIVDAIFESHTLKILNNKVLLEIGYLKRHPWEILLSFYSHEDEDAIMKHFEMFTFICVATNRVFKDAT